MEAETGRLNPLSARDWAWCINQVPDSPLWLAAKVCIAVLAAGALFSGFTDALDQIAAMEAEGWGVNVLGITLAAGAFALGYLWATATLSLVTGVALMARGKRPSAGEIEVAGGEAEGDE